MTLRRLAALNRAWERVPPPGVALMRIAESFGATLAPASGKAPRAAPPEPSARELAALDSLPTAPMTKYLTPEQYLAQRGSTDG
jgi:hypothetical protein